MGTESALAKRVVVTGVGCVTPLGANYAETLASALAGRSGVGPTTHFDASDFSCRIAAEYSGELAPSVLGAKDLRRTNRCVLFALEATAEALADSDLDIEDGNRERIGVAIGSGIGGLGTILENDAILRESVPRRVSPFTIPMGISNMSSGMVSVHHGLQGPNICHVSACASGSHAIGEGVRLIQRGEADAMVVGGAEAPILGVTVAGFASMKAVSTRNDAPQQASRPFDRARDGFVVGEGAGILVIESLERALARGARIRAEVIGYGASADATHMVAPDSEGTGAALCMQRALDEAGLPREEVGYVNAHATSTPAGDVAEVVRLGRAKGGPRRAALSKVAERLLDRSRVRVASASEAAVAQELLRGVDVGGEGDRAGGGVEHREDRCVQAGLGSGPVVVAQPGSEQPLSVHTRHQHLLGGRAQEGDVARWEGSDRRRFAIDPLHLSVGGVPGDPLRRDREGLHRGRDLCDRSRMVLGRGWVGLGLTVTAGEPDQADEQNTTRHDSPLRGSDSPSISSAFRGTPPISPRRARTPLRSRSGCRCSVAACRRSARRSPSPSS